MILAVETSCDDTCAAVLDERGRIRSSIRSDADWPSVSVMFSSCDGVAKLGSQS